jgi:transcriptional regulator with XRE-family HTH domain
MVWIEIRKVLMEHGISLAQIARDAGVSKTLVSLVIRGKRHNLAVLEALRKRGCPLEMLLMRNKAA